MIGSLYSLGKLDGSQKIRKIVEEGRLTVSGTIEDKMRTNYESSQRTCVKQGKSNQLNE